MVCFDMAGEKLRRTDFWKRKTDPYFVIHRTKHQEETEEQVNKSTKRMQLHTQKSLRSFHETDGSNKRNFEIDDAHELEQAILRSEVVRRRNSPHWKRVKDVSAQDMCHGEGSQPIVIEVFDWFRTCRPRIIGTAETTYDAMYACFWKNAPLCLDVCVKKRIKVEGLVMPKKVAVGQLIMDTITVDRRFTFLDFIRGGTTITPLIALDMTRGNLDHRHTTSLHHLGAGAPNDYATTIKAVLEVMQLYQGPEAVVPGGAAIDAFPMYGFGAKVPPAKNRCLDCFSLTGDFLMPFAHGIWCS
jgi:hypothetical protein